MQLINILLVPFLLFTSFTQAEVIESAIGVLAENFPHMVQINTKEQVSVASNGQSSFTAGAMIYPENEKQLIDVINFFAAMKKKDNSIRPLVIAAGSRKISKKVRSGWSFDAHAQGRDGDIVLSTSKLSGIYKNIDWKNDFDHEKQTVKVWAFAGTPWRELVNLVNKEYYKQTGDKQNYFVPIISPTGSQITIGGSFASNTHARGTSIKGGYFADTIDAFHLVTHTNDKASMFYVDKEATPDLFYALVGSFGRGGIVTAIKINLQMVSKDKVATTRLKKVTSIEEMTQEFARDRLRLLADSSYDLSAERNAFMASVGIISEDFETFFMLENDLEKPKAEMPSFPLYGAPDCKAKFIYKASRALPKLADYVAGKYLDWHCAETPCEFFSGVVTGMGEFHDQPLNNYIFFQDTFALNIVENDPKDFQTSHFTIMLRLENLPRVMHEIKRIKMLPQFEDITFELQDLLPLPSTQVLMAPGYSETKNDDMYIAYTLSWPIDDYSRDNSRAMQAMMEQELYDIKVGGQPLAWLHPLKEFSFKKDRIEFYAQSAEKLEQILQKYSINDRPLFHSRVHDYLYNK